MMDEMSFWSMEHAQDNFCGNNAASPLSPREWQDCVQIYLHFWSLFEATYRRNLAWSQRSDMYGGEVLIQ